jgi:hypothetical protein
MYIHMYVCMYVRMRNIILQGSGCLPTLSKKKKNLLYLCIRDKCNQGLKVNIFKCLNWIKYFKGFLPAHDEPLADLTNFNIIHYTQPEMGRAWNLLCYTGLSYTGLHLMAAHAVATTIQSPLFPPDTFVYWFPHLNYMYSHQCNSLYSNCSNLQHSKTILWQIPTNRWSILVHL